MDKTHPPTRECVTTLIRQSRLRIVPIGLYANGVSSLIISIAISILLLCVAPSLISVLLKQLN